MIQDIFPHKLHNEFEKDAKPSENDTVFCFNGGKLLVKVDEEVHFPKVSDFKEGTEFTFLFRLDEKPYFLLNDSNNQKVCGEESENDIFDELKSEGFEFMEVRTLRYKKIAEKEEMFAVMTGKHLADWYRDMRFCGRCGKKMEHAKTERAMKCSCGNRAYPRIMPAVIVGVTNGDKILLTKYRTGSGYNALIAGFTEIGETVEETVKREVMEEAGIKVKNLRYYKSQPWGIANDILMGFYCDVDGDDNIHMDQNELKYAQWVERDAIELQPDDFSLTNEMMTRFKEGAAI